MIAVIVVLSILAWVDREQPESAPNTFNLKFYLVGNVFYCEGHCFGEQVGDSNNVFYQVQLHRNTPPSSSNTSWMELRMNDRGLTHTNSRSQTLLSGITYNVRYYDNGPGWAVDFTFTVP